jgi:hypothetical protein
VRLGLLQRFLDLSKVAIEVNAVVPQRQHFTQAAREERHHRGNIRTSAWKLGHKTGDIPNDHHLFIIDL